MMKMIENPTSVIIIVVLMAVVSINQSAAFAQQQQQGTTTNQFYSEPTTTNFRDSNLAENNQLTQLVDVPVILNNNNNKLSPSTNLNNLSTATTNSDLSMATSNFYSSSQAPKFRVNVSNVCDQNQMHVIIRLSRPFYGLIHTKEKRKKAGCFIEGNGEQTYTLDISYTLVQSEQAYCGVTSSQYFTKYANQTTSHSHQQQQTLSVTLVVRLHKTIEFSDDRHFLLNCANRCSRPDCSSLSGQANSSLNAAAAAGSQAAFTRTGFVASESILSPILRASANELVQSQSNSRLTNNLANLINSSPINSTSCDLVLELRFKWLIGICSFLAALLVVSICIAVYLCNALTNKSEDGSRGTHKKRKSHSANTLRNLQQQQQDEGECLQITVPQQVISSSSSNQVQEYHQHQHKQQQHRQQQHELMCWPLVVAADGRTTSGNSVATSGTVVCSSQANDCQLLDKIRDDNSYLAKQQHQQYIVSNNLVPISNHHKPPTVADNRQQMFGMAASSSTTHNTLGASQPLGSKDQRGRHLNANIRRRRSFGADYSMPESNHNHPIEFDQIGSSEEQRQVGGFDHTFGGARFDANQRAKSRSQTTIYYEQSQDPFKAVPFSYHLTNTNTTTNTNNNNNNYSGYLSDTAAVLGGNQQQIGYSTQQQRFQPPNYQLSSMPPAPTRLVKLEDQQLVQQQQPPTTSQFDPKNSSQLIELIQKKHRQQMEQANRTAATMQHQAHLWQAHRN